MSEHTNIASGTIGVVVQVADVVGDLDLSGDGITITTPANPAGCPGDPAEDWREMGWCCAECAMVAHVAWCPVHGLADIVP